MNKLRIIFASLAALLITSLVPLSQAVAASPISACNGVAKNTDVCATVNAQGTGTNPIINIIKAAIEVISYVAGALAIIIILLSAIRMITAGGNAQTAAQARSGFTYALIGIVIAVLAQVIVAFVLNKV